MPINSQQIRDEEKKRDPNTAPQQLPRLRQMDRNGKLPSKGTLLAPMLNDVLVSMCETHMNMLRSEAAQLHLQHSPPSTVTIDVQLPPSIAGGASAPTPNDAAAASDGELLEVSRSPPQLTSPSGGTEGGSSFHSNSTNPITSPTPTANHALFGAAAPTGGGKQSAPDAGGKELSTAAARAAQLGVTESDLLFAYRLCRHLIDSVLQLKDCVEVISSGVVRKLATGFRALAPLDHSLALYACTIFSNLAGFSDARVVLSSTAVDLFDTTLLIATTFVMERRITHLALMTLSNLSACDAVRPSPQQCENVVQLVMPSYAEAQVVEAWCCTIVNITASHPSLVKEFIRLGVVETLNRILLFLGDDSRVVTRGLQCLSNLACPSTD